MSHSAQTYLKPATGRRQTPSNELLFRATRVEPPRRRKNSYGIDARQLLRIRSFLNDEAPVPSGVPASAEITFFPVSAVILLQAGVSS